MLVAVAAVVVAVVEAVAAASVVFASGLIGSSEARDQIVFCFL